MRRVTEGGGNAPVRFALRSRPVLRALSTGLLGIVVAALAGAACGSRGTHETVDARPSFLLVVIDTLRADAVSAYGAVEGTTPHIDALAAEGLRYANAYAPAPWTLPSHATLFTGLGPERHGVGLEGRMALPGDLDTLAGLLGAAGYETAGFSENPILGRPLGFARGFEHFVGASDAVAARAAGHPDARFDLVLGVSGWARQRGSERPFFVFVNLFDAHDPYELHEDHLFLPPGVDPSEARRVGSGAPMQGVAEFAGMCDRLPPRRELDILRGLYLGEVAAADAKLGALRRAVAAAAPGPLVTIVTSDHGEHLGEHRLLGHEFSLRTEVLHVPLVVQGLPGARPALIEAPVGLADLAPTVLDAAGVAVPEAWPGRPLPRHPGEGDPQRPLFAVWSDAPLRPPEGFRTDHARQADRRRLSCGPEDRVFGDILALTRPPYKLLWYERNPPQLYDLRWDAGERSDVAAHHPEVVARMTREIDALRATLEETTSSETPPLDPAAIEALRQLGYVE